jgi:pyruvate formate lyase activating enzyme
MLPYHKTAGAKYGMVGMKYDPGFNSHQSPNPDTCIFTARGIPCALL